MRLVGLSRTTCSTEKPSVSRVKLSALSHTLRAALERARTSMPMPLCWMPCPGNAYTVFGAASWAVADITRSEPEPAPRVASRLSRRTRALISKTSAPWSIPTRSTRKSTSSPGRTMPRKRAVQPTSRAGGRAWPSVAVTTCCAAADSHMPCTIGPPSPLGAARPASRAAARSVWIGLWSPDTTANGRMSTGAVRVTSRRRRRGVSVALSDTAPPARAGSPSSPEPVRPRIANRSSSTASTAPPAAAMVTETGTTRPTSVSAAVDAVAVTVNSAGPVGSGPTRRAAWSRCTRLSRPSITGTPAAVTAEPMAANTAGQHGPTSASGTVVRPGASGSPKVAVTPVWSATRSGFQATVTHAVPACTRGSASGPSTPAAMASTARIAVTASLARTTGMPPSTVQSGRVNRMSTQAPDIGTLNTT